MAPSCLPFPQFFILFQSYSQVVEQTYFRARQNLLEMNRRASFMRYETLDANRRAGFDNAFSQNCRHMIKRDVLGIDHAHDGTKLSEMTVNKNSFLLRHLTVLSKKICVLLNALLNRNKNQQLQIALMDFRSLDKLKNLKCNVSESRATLKFINL